MPENTEDRLKKLELEIEKLRSGEIPLARAVSSCSNCSNRNDPSPTGPCVMSVPTPQNPPER
jgi:hypothetical protein